MAASDRNCNSCAPSAKPPSLLMITGRGRAVRETFEEFSARENFVRAERERFQDRGDDDAWPIDFFARPMRKKSGSRPTRQARVQKELTAVRVDLSPKPFVSSGSIVVCNSINKINFVQKQKCMPAC